MQFEREFPLKIPSLGPPTQTTPRSSHLILYWSMSETATKKIGGQDRVVEPEAVIASLTKQNNKLKNELKFTKETERWAWLI